MEGAPSEVGGVNMKFRKFDGSDFRRIAITPHSRSSAIAQMAKQARNIGYNARVVKTSRGTQLYVRPSAYRIRRKYNAEPPPIYGLERGALYSTALKVALGRPLSASDEILLEDEQSRAEVARQSELIMEKYDRARIEQISAELAADAPTDPVRFMIDRDRALNSQVDAAVASRVISKLGNIAVDNYFIQDPSVTEQMRTEFDNYSPEDFGTWDDILKYSESTRRYVLHNRSGDPVGTFSEDTVNKAAAEAEQAIIGNMRMEMSDDIPAIQEEIRATIVRDAQEEFDRVIESLEEPEFVRRDGDMVEVDQGGTELEKAIAIHDTGTNIPELVEQWKSESTIQEPTIQESTIQSWRLEQGREPRQFDERPLSHVEVREFLEACGRGDASRFLCRGVTRIDYPDWQYSESQVEQTLAEFGLGAQGDLLIETAKGIGIGNDGSRFLIKLIAVSYTHLTLPTNREV